VLVRHAMFDVDAEMLPSAGLRHAIEAARRGEQQAAQQPHSQQPRASQAASSVVDQASRQEAEQCAESLRSLPGHAPAPAPQFSFATGIDAGLRSLTVPPPEYGSSSGGGVLITSSSSSSSSDPQRDGAATRRGGFAPSDTAGTPHVAAVPAFGLGEAFIPGASGSLSSAGSFRSSSSFVGTFASKKAHSAATLPSQLPPAASQQQQQQQQQPTHDRRMTDRLDKLASINDVLLNNVLHVAGQLSATLETLVSRVEELTGTVSALGRRVGGLEMHLKRKRRILIEEDDDDDAGEDDARIRPSSDAPHAGGGSR